MENEEQKLPVKQNESTHGSKDIDRIKELFEYEMTEVLLGFKREAVRFKRKDVSQYLDMELPPAGVDYVSSETELDSVDYNEAKPIEPIDLSITAPEITKTDMPDIPKLSEISTDIKATVPYVSVAVMDVPQNAAVSCSEQVTVLPVTTDIPHVPDAAVDLSKINDCTLPDKLIEKALIESRVIVPQIETSRPEIPSLSVPETDKYRVEADIVPVDMKVSMSASEINSSEIDSGKLTVGSVNVSGGQVSFPFSGKSELSFDFDGGFSDDDIIQKGIVFKPVQNLNFSHEIMPYGKISADTNVPLPEHYGVNYDTEPVVVDKVQTLANIKEIDVKKDLFSAAEVNLSGVSISVPEVVPVGFPSFLDVEIAPPDYPEIPEKPDFSDWYSDILESAGKEKN